MQTEFIIISTLIVVSFAAVILVQLKSQGKSEGLSLLQSQMNNLSQTFDSRLGETGKEVTRKIKESNEVIREITERSEIERPLID